MQALSSPEFEIQPYLDPYAHRAPFPIVSKILHSVAREYGVSVLDEAFCYHRLLGAMNGDTSGRRFSLAPHLERLGDFSELMPRPDSVRVTRKTYSWLDIVALTGEPARTWVNVYRDCQRATAEPLDSGLRLLRQGHLNRGLDCLQIVEEDRQQFRQSHPSIFRVIGRFYHSEMAYYWYQLGDLCRAEDELDEAAEDIVGAIDCDRFLLPIAPLVIDVPFQKSRVARRRRDWSSMRNQLELFYRMETGECPLCTLADGTAVDYASLETFFTTVQLQPGQAVALGHMDMQSRLRRFLRLTAPLYALPGLITLSQPMLE